MFDKDLIELTLKKKREELRNTPTTNTSDADRLLREIRYLKATLARYKIAVLLKLDGDPDYVKNDYLGIEEEDVTKFNLNPTQMGEYNHLISLLPGEQLKRFKIRKQMADILGEERSSKFGEGYVGIENIDPNLTKYGLTKEQIKDFQDLINDINNIAQDSTKSVDVKKEAIEMLESAFNKLNIDDIDQYNNIKGPYLDTIDNLVKHIDEEGKKQVFGAGVSNYEFANDLAQKYPELNIKMDIKGVEKLLNMLENSNLDEDKYNDYMKFLRVNINSLYEDDANKATIENLLNNINLNNFSFRHDLLPITANIKNVDLSLKDDELELVFRFLDTNYDKLDEKDREKYYSLVESKIKCGLDDLDKVDQINSLLLSINNKGLEERLQNTFSSNKHAEFKNQHQTSYQQLVQEEIAKLEKLKSRYVSKKPRSGFMATYYETKEAEIDKEIEKLKQIKENYDNNPLISRLNSTYNKGTERANDLEREIAELKNLKEQVQSKFHSRLIDRKIENRNKRINRLRSIQGRIVGAQKTIMTPKLFVDQKRGMVNRHFEAKEEVFQNYANDYQQMAATERNLKGMFSGIKAAFYDLQANRYQNKATFNQHICDVLANSKVTIKGRNKRMMNKNTLHNIQQNQQQQVQVQTI